MKILFCSNVFPPHVIGGAELVAYYHAKVLRDKGCEIAVFCGDPSETAPRYTLQESMFEGMSVFRIHLRPEDFSSDYVNFWKNRTWRSIFEKILSRFRPDVVHMHNLIGLSGGLIGKGKSRGIPIVLTVHDHWGFCYKNTLIKTESELCKDYTRCAECLTHIHDGNYRSIPIRLRRDFLALQLSQLDALISPSKYLSGAYGRAGVPAGTRRVIEYGIDVKRYARVSKSPRTGRVRFTFIGYLGAHKGVLLLIDAARMLRKAGIVINLVGVGYLMDELRARVESEGLSKIVRFWGKTDNEAIETVFRETDVLILPSIWPENQPVTILESMATQTAVIASRIGGITEMVVDGETGYLFEPGNAMELVDRMTRFVQHRSGSRSSGPRPVSANPRQQSYGNSIAKLLALYEEIRERRADGRRWYGFDRLRGRAIQSSGSGGGDFHRQVAITSILAVRHGRVDFGQPSATGQGVMGGERCRVN